jgi:hypothetical protein
VPASARVGVGPTREVVFVDGCVPAADADALGALRIGA